MPEDDPKGYLEGIDFESYREALRERESQNDYSVINKLGFVGAYQMGTAALIEAGLVRRGAPRKNSALKDPKNWILPGGLQTFLNSPEIQDKAFEKYTESNARGLARQGLLPESPEAKAGTLASSHLLGWPTIAKHLNGEKIKDSDAFGTTMAEYEEIGMKSQSKPETKEVRSNLSQRNRFF